MAELCVIMRLVVKDLSACIYEMFGLIRNFLLSDRNRTVDKSEFACYVDKCLRGVLGRQDGITSLYTNVFLR